MSTTEAELFPGADYEVPFPQVDGRDVDVIALRINGNITLNRNDPEHAAFVESLTLGRYVRLEVMASVTAKGQAWKAGDEELPGRVEYVIGLKAHSADVAP